MSDYGGDDYSDGGDEYYYVEEEYMVADDLAEHAVQSPPPMNVVDEDLLEDWDRFDYFNDLEYDSDGYDNAAFAPNDASWSKVIGRKRKRTKVAESAESVQRRLKKPAPRRHNGVYVRSHAPVIWRSQADREAAVPPFVDDRPSFALLKDWRQRMRKTPRWIRRRSATPDPLGDLESPRPQVSLEHDPEEVADIPEDAPEIDPAALMAILQQRVAAAGGPLSGMDPQQMLQFAMRMMGHADEGDDIAGEMADALLEQGDDEDEDEEEAGGKLLSWVAQQRDGDAGSGANGLQDPVSPPQSPPARQGILRPPTPPSSEANRSICTKDTDMSDVRQAEDGLAKTRHVEVEQVSRKRKLDLDADADAETVSKRPARLSARPAAADQATVGATKSTRSGRMKK